MKAYFFTIAQQGMFGVGAARPKIFMSFLALADEIMHKPSSLTPLQREVLGAYISKQFGCDFCHLGHLDTVEATAGKDARSLVDNPTEDYAALFRFADAVPPTQLRTRKLLSLSPLDLMRLPPRISCS